MNHIKLFEEFWPFKKKNIDELQNEWDEEDTHDSLAEEIDGALEYGTEDDKYELLEEILPQTYFGDKQVYIDNLFTILRNVGYNPNPALTVDIDSNTEIRRTLKSISRLLKNKTKLNNIRVYAPNHGTPYFTVSTSDLSFSS